MHNHDKMTHHKNNQEKKTAKQEQIMNWVCVVFAIVCDFFVVVASDEINL